MFDLKLGAGTRLFGNLMTAALSAYAGWGWCAKVQSWPPGVADSGYLVLAALTLSSQHLANGAVVLAFRAFQAGLWITGVGGLVLAILFAGVTARGVDHAWTVSQQLQRAELMTPIETAIATTEADLQTNHEALRALPSDIPGSRIRILQAPLNAAIDRGEARLEQLRAELNAIASAPPKDDGAHRVIWVLGFAEPALYWLLAAGETSQRRVASGPHVPPADIADRERVPPRRASQARSGGRVPRPYRASRNLLAALAWFMPGAAYPPARERDTLIEAAAAPAGGTPNTTETGVGSNVQSHMSGGRSERGVPAWLDHAHDLRSAGLSYRAIGRQLNVPKSTVGRWLKRD